LSLNRIASPITPPTPVRVIDVALDRGAHFHQELNAGENAFVLVHAGVAEITGVRVHAGAVGVLSSDGERLSIAALDEAARFTVFAGSPLRQHRVQRGPFVANDADQLQRFVSHFQRSGFGALTPFAAQPDWKPNDGQELAP